MADKYSTFYESLEYLFRVADRIITLTRSQDKVWAKKCNIVKGVVTKVIDKCRAESLEDPRSWLSKFKPGFADFLTLHHDVFSQPSFTKTDQGTVFVYSSFFKIAERKAQSYEFQKINPPQGHYCTFQHGTSVMYFPISELYQNIYDYQEEKDEDTDELMSLIHAFLLCLYHSTSDPDPVLIDNIKCLEEYATDPRTTNLLDNPDISQMAQKMLGVSGLDKTPIGQHLKNMNFEKIGGVMKQSFAKTQSSLQGQEGNQSIQGMLNSVMGVMQDPAMMEMMQSLAPGDPGLNKTIPTLENPGGKMD